ncbi:mechanosensitive ion channel family protein [Pedobacter xixiisoli]|uniref:Small-conductance mechanosensitive channel n=1 Tax=Pedobacter xixiisoli TaxID=1476464 RepID=A0A285ZWQ3_9SPHI|nr:mechanosensitive ion channel domain-containing protein [Pedobacter xixiisoli]SOD14048.1 Small-conductance mechanosensitive channel [Pedobacter xixiisoli]
MHRYFSKYFPLFFFLLLAGFTSNAQTIDSSKTIPDTLLFRIQKAQSVITEVNAANKKGYQLELYRNSINEVKQTISPLQQDFKRKGKEIDQKNLQSYELILKDATDRLSRLRNNLIKNSNELQRMSGQIVALSNDTVLRVANTGDAEKLLYQQQLSEIKLRLQQTGEATGKNLDEVGRLLADVSALDIVVNDLKAQVTERLQLSGKVALGREVPYIWDTSWLSKTDGGFWANLSSSYLGQKQILTYFIDSTWDKRLLSILFSVAFFIWVHRNFKLSQRAAVRRKIGVLTFSYLKPFPVLAMVIVALNIIPLFETGAPSLYIELLQLFLLLAITIHLRKVLPSKQLFSWLKLVIAYALLVVISSISADGLILRLALLGLNIYFIYMGIRLLPKIRLQQFPKKYTKLVLLIFISFNALALLLNVFGRLSLAKSFALTGVVGLVQLVGLAVFVQLILDALELQIRISSCSKGFFSRVEHNHTRASSKKVLWWLAAVIWVIVFLINMNLTSGTLVFFETMLTKQRTFGSIHFTLGNILFFLLIIYLANKLQKNVPVIFGEGNLSYEGQVEQKSSKVALIRLIIIVLAFLLAITASGLPMDRVTVVLGALGVGIGLGMQNIVNNFVSGIILIFERPFRIGDFVELADKKGRVKDIGIRSSKLLTQQGSEVIIPNGDLLSGRLVNWTLNHDYVKTELIFKVNAETDLDLLNKIIKDQIGKANHVMERLQTEILVNAILANAIEIKVLTWVESIYVEPAFKSELMMSLLKRFKEEGITIM